MVEARGVEPLSESLSEGLSTSVASALTFPPLHAQRQAYSFSSFMKSDTAQSFAMLVPHITDARIRRRGHLRADGSRLYAATKFVFVVSVNLTFPDFNEARGFGSLIRHP